MTTRMNFPSRKKARRKVALDNLKRRKFKKGQETYDGKNAEECRKAEIDILEDRIASEV